MPVKSQALIVEAIDAPFVLHDIIVDDAGPGELLVRIETSGICHSDLSVQNGTIPGCPFPCVLGHEGGGVIEQVGAGVEGFEIGDKVLLSFNSCGDCRNCNKKLPGACDTWIPLNFSFARPNGNQSLGTREGSTEPIRAAFFGQSSFAKHTLVYPRSCVKVPATTDLTYLSPLGCGIQTGFGAVYNVLKPTSEDYIGVWGLGGVGMSGIIAAVILKAKIIIAVDIVESRLALAKELGATHAINGRDKDVKEQILKITGRGLDFTLDASGAVQCVEMAWSCLSARGKHGQVGVVPHGKYPQIDVQEAITFGKSFIGIMEGDSNPHDFVPLLAKFVESGELPIKKISKLFPIADFQKALDAMHDGSVLKPILVF